MIIAEKPQIIKTEKTESVNKNEVFTIENIEAEIKKYNGIYDKELLEYLKSLLMLEINIVNDKTYSKKKLELLKDIELFKRILKYNIFGYARKTLEKSGIETTREYDENNTYLFQSYNGIPIFDACISKEDIYEEKAKFTIYELSENKELRNEKLEELYQKYDTISDGQNPYKDEANFKAPKSSRGKRKIGYVNIGKQLFNDYEDRRKKELNLILDAIERLEIRKELSEEQKKSQEQSQKVYEAFEKEYGPFKPQNEKIESSSLLLEESTSTTSLKETQFVKMYKHKRYY